MLDFRLSPSTVLWRNVLDSGMWKGRRSTTDATLRHVLIKPTGYYGVNQLLLSTSLRVEERRRREEVEGR